MTSELSFIWKIHSFSLIQVSFPYLEIKQISFQELNFIKDIRMHFYFPYTVIFLNPSFFPIFKNYRN